MSMAWVAGGVAVAGVAGVAIGSKAAKDAAESASDSNQDTLNAQREMFDQTRTDNEPFRQVGIDALDKYYRSIGVKPSLTDNEQWLLNQSGTEGAEGLDQEALQRARDKQTSIEGWDDSAGEAPELSPLAQWQQQEFNKVQNRQDAARGLSGSGGASARLGEGSMQIAGQDYQNSYNRILDALKLGSGNGASAGNANMMNAIGTAGKNDQQITLDQGQSEGNFWAGAGNTVGQGLATYQSNQTPGGGTAPTGGGFNGNPNPSMGAGGYTAIQPGM
jgi:hypothetical protein